MLSLMGYGHCVSAAMIKPHIQKQLEEERFIPLSHPYKWESEPECSTGILRQETKLDTID